MPVRSQCNRCSALQLTCAMQLMQCDTADIERIILDNIPLMDVRAPVEFDRGCIGDAVNAPLLDDQQREMIGSEYANNGQQAAIALGLDSVTEAIKENRLQRWQQFIQLHPNGYLYCFRGGMRSDITQLWLKDAGVSYPKVVGGYKAMRRFLLAQFERLATEGNILTLAAPTGSGKTDLICRLNQSVDIEGMARHRGSAFGSLFVPQPSQINWENEVASEWFRVSKKSTAPVMFEAESHLIGKISLPVYLQEALRAAPVVELITSTEDRITRIRDDYINTAMTVYRAEMSEQQSYLRLEEFISHNLGRIQRRLGGERYQRLIALVPGAVNELQASTGTDSMDEIVRTLLHDYYDPLYAHKMIGRESQLVFKGTADEIAAWVE